MGLFEKLRSLLGLEKPTEEASTEGRDVGITVEREGDEEPSRRAGRSQDPEEYGDDDATTAGPSAADTPAATGSGSDTATTASAAPTPDAEPDDGAEERRVPSEAVDVIKGIGPTYAGRLSDAGIETVEDLAAADADDVVERADVPESRLEEWIERAKSRSR